MGYRITPKRLQTRFETLASLIGWDISGPAWTRIDNRNVGKIGHTFLEHNSCYGWSINQLMNEGGGERRLKESCTASQMDEWLGGAIYAAYELRKVREAA